MGKTKQKKAGKPQPAEPAKKGKPELSPEEQREASARWWREAVESVVVAIVLALLFRTFEAEAFVIPTGSMAPTLQGRHKDVVCEKCGYEYRAGASEEDEKSRGVIRYSTCPMCRYTMALDWDRDYHHDSFTGDRILVNKFAYQFGEPQRWDVIVFKFPGNAKQNYIKRLVGLPGETIRIRHGDIFTRRSEDEDFTIARKPPRKLIRMLQPVHDTNYIPHDLIDVGWPARWQGVQSSSDGGAAGTWTVSADRKTYTLEPDPSGAETWLRYRHIVPTLDDWDLVDSGRKPPDMDQRQGELITDFYAYNASINHGYSYFDPDRVSYEILSRLTGLHWVGDLAVECELDVLSDTGEVLLDLVEGGHHYQCTLDVSDGRATLTIDGGKTPFAHQKDGQPVYSLSQTTDVRGPGSYRIRLANVDDQLSLWVAKDTLLSWLWSRQTPVAFDAGGTECPGAYEPSENVRPHWSPEDPGDLSPVGIGGKNVSIQVNRLRVLRDVYYIAARDTRVMEPTVDYDLPLSSSGRRVWRGPDDMVHEIRTVFTHPSLWAETGLFDLRRFEDFELGEDQFFPLGDNSPKSKDARLWWQTGGDLTVESCVERRLLTGKAFLIYWPHPWYAGTRRLPIIPNFGRMGLIR